MSCGSEDRGLAANWPPIAASVALPHDQAQAADHAGGPAVVPVGGVSWDGPSSQVGGGPEMVEPGQFPSSLGMVGPAWSDLVREVVGVLRTEDGFDPVGQFAELLVALLLGHPEPEPGRWSGVVLLAEDREDLFDLVTEVADVVQGGRVFALHPVECAYLGG